MGYDKPRSYKWHEIGNFKLNYWLAIHPRWLVLFLYWAIPYWLGCSSYMALKTSEPYELMYLSTIVHNIYIYICIVTIVCFMDFLSIKRSNPRSRFWNHNITICKVYKYMQCPYRVTLLSKTYAMKYSQQSNPRPSSLTYSKNFPSLHSICIVGIHILLIIDIPWYYNLVFNS